MRRVSLFTPFCVGIGFTARTVPSINKNFLLLEGFRDLFPSLFGEKLLISGPTLKMIFECKRLVKFKFLTLARCISQRWLRFWVYINSIFHAHAHFQDCTNHDTQNIILWVEKYFAKTTLDSTMASTNAHYTQWVDRLKSY